MARYRDGLPQRDGGPFLTDGGIETTMIFHEGLELPDFAAFHLLRTREGEVALRKYFRSYAEIAKAFGAGLILESATWRASADWGRRLGYSNGTLAHANFKAIRMLETLRDEYASATPVVISGCVGPRGDGYVVEGAMTVGESEAYHRRAIAIATGLAVAIPLTMRWGGVGAACGPLVSALIIGLMSRCHALSALGVEIAARRPAAR